MIIQTIPTYSQYFYLFDIMYDVDCLIILQGDKYVQADVSVEDKDYPHNSPYTRAEVYMHLCEERERQRETKKKWINVYIFFRFIQGQVG